MKTKHIICAFLFTGLILSCGSTKTLTNPDDKLIGEWSLIAESTPQGDVPITMTITKNEAGKFEGSFKSMMGEFDMTNLVLKNGVMSCDFDVQGILFEFKGVFTNDEFNGETLGPAESYITNGKRKVE
ncbi:hypothetical protein [Winogradskyella sp. R77965]|uniref:hypothetical protein n=1 Tax=Winogradskyella sp. R77965 TaxID=3093872 RepID=UPI0037DD2CEB